MCVSVTKSFVVAELQFWFLVTAIVFIFFQKHVTYMQLILDMLCYFLYYLIPFLRVYSESRHALTSVQF